MQKFTMTEDHLKLLKHMRVSWDDSGYGAPTIDAKRPYGNSGILGDMASILGMADAFNQTNLFDEETLMLLGIGLQELHRQTQLALQICLATQSFEPGEYVAPDYTNEWIKVSHE